MVDNKEYDIVIKYDTNWNNDYYTYNNLIQLYNTLDSCEQKKVLLDFKNVEFVSANLLAVLGGILDVAVIEKKHTVTFGSIHPKVKKVMLMNGFRKYFSWDTVEDVFHSTMEYKIFQATTENLEEFEKYILINVFSRKGMPHMSGTVKDRMIDNFLEMFNNVIDHAISNKVYICGQYFHRSDNLVLSIVDFGRTIKENVLEFLGAENKCIDNTLEWAIIPGNSTKSESAPGGLGFSIILDFVDLNNGGFTLISDSECYEINKSGKRFLKMENSFKGTIVTITFNLGADFAYILEENDINDIIF